MGELSIADQRDRFVAFAFAASDVLIEIDAKGSVCFVAGSVKSLFAHSTEEIMGTEILDSATKDNRVAFSEFIAKLMSSGRAAETLIDLNGGDGKVHTAAVSGMASPQRPGIFHLAFRQSTFMMRVAQASRAKSPVTAEEHAAHVEKTARAAEKSGDVLNFAMFDVDLEGAEKQGMTDKDSEKLSASLVETMQAWSADGSVGEISRGKYSVLLEDGVDVSRVKNRMTEVAKMEVPNVDLGISETALSIDDLVDTDDFAETLESAMTHFDRVGGEMFDLTSLEDAKKLSKAASVPPRGAGSKGRPVVRARRQGVVEGWG